MMIAVILFGVAALGGVYLALLRFKNQPFPMPVSIVHGLVAAAGLVALIIQYFSGGVNGTVQVALILFIIVALGGFVAFSYHLRKLTLPIGLMVVHGGLAVIAFLVLLKGVFWT